MRQAKSLMKALGFGASDVDTIVDVTGPRCSTRYSTVRTLEDDYQVQNVVLGTGMSGDVRLINSRSDGRRYALKSFQKTGVPPKRRAALKSEAEIHLCLDHPHVARLEMVYETSKEMHLVCEYMPGGELYDRLAEKGHFTEEAAARSTQQMLLAVAYLHANNYAHRDLKLQNFLYDGEGNLKLIDLGLAMWADENTKMSQACGTLQYMAPEVLTKSYTNKVDMWSMGVIVYMLLTGRPPIYGSDEEVIKNIRAGSPRWSSRFQKLSKLARDFLQSLLTNDPALRMSAQEALQHPWILQWNQPPEVVIDTGIITRLQEFASASKFKKEVLNFMTWSLPDADVVQLRRQFLALDNKNTGMIDIEDFKTLVESSSQLNAQEAEELFRRLDTDASKHIEYSEFLAAALSGSVEVHDSVLRKTFARFDCDGNGKLCVKELRSILGDAAVVEDLLREADTSGDGSLDFDEFLAYFHGEKLRRRESAPKREAPPCEGKLQSLKRTWTGGDVGRAVDRFMANGGEVSLDRAGALFAIGGMASLAGIVICARRTLTR